MDKYEVDARIAEMELYDAQRTYPRCELREVTIRNVIKKLREKSRTYTSAE